VERIEEVAENLRREARGVWKLVTVRLGDIEGHNRKEMYLR
jgi:hypothetical protein